MTVSLNPCGICNQMNEKPLVCKRCLIRWKVMFGEPAQREAAEATATKVNSCAVRGSSRFPYNPLFKKF